MQIRWPLPAHVSSHSQRTSNLFGSSFNKGVSPSDRLRSSHTLPQPLLFVRLQPVPLATLARCTGSDSQIAQSGRIFYYTLFGGSFPSPKPLGRRNKEALRQRRVADRTNKRDISANLRATTTSSFYPPIPLYPIWPIDLSTTRSHLIPSRGPLGWLNRLPNVRQSSARQFTFTAATTFDPRLK